MDQPKIPDPAEMYKGLAGKDKISSWTAEQWIDFVERHPDCTLPGGVAKMILDHFNKNLVEIRDALKAIRAMI
jgi:hypothetical protein